MGKRGPKPGTPPSGRSVETLIKPGEVKNPTGRSREEQLIQKELNIIVGEFLAEKIELERKKSDGTITKEESSRLKGLLENLYRGGMAADGGLPYIQELFDRGFGLKTRPKPPQTRGFNDGGESESVDPRAKLAALIAGAATSKPAQGGDGGNKPARPKGSRRASP